MKTAMQELIDMIEEGKIHCVLDVLLEASKLIYKEKRQINNGYFEGYEDGYDQNSDVDYYEETYNK